MNYLEKQRQKQQLMQQHGDRQTDRRTDGRTQQGYVSETFMNTICTSTTRCLFPYVAGTNRDLDIDPTSGKSTNPALLVSFKRFGKKYS